MPRDYQIAVFEDGELHVVRAGSPGREAVLALPLSRLLAKMVRVAAGEDPVAAATPVLQAMSPFPDEPLTVSCETVRTRDDGSSVVLAAALPESATDDIAEALDAQKLSVTRVDLLALGDREAAVCIELTKLHERVSRGYLSDLVKEYADAKVKGEVALVIAGSNPKFRRAEGWDDACPKALKPPCDGG